MDVRFGLIGMFGIWATMAMMSLAELLPLDAYQLLALRGGPGVVLLLLGVVVGICRIELPDRHTTLIALLFLVASLGLFEAVKEWGANLSVVLLDMAVLVNFIFAASRRQKVDPTNIAAFCVAIVGSYFAMRGWDLEHLNVAGLLWSLLALTANGLFIEYASAAKQPFPTKIFWMSGVLVCAGLLSSQSWSMPAGAVSVALWFGVSTGFVNFMSAFLALNNLKPVWTGTLLLGVTPSVLLASWLIIDRVLGVDQLAGISLILVSVGYLGYWLNRTKS